MSILKTTQVIKVKVAANGGLQPLSSAPVVLKNTVREDILLSQLADVVANSSANGAYLVYNSAINKYEVKVVTTNLDDISNFDSTPGGVPASNGDIIVFNSDTGTYEVKPISIALNDLTDVNAVSPADGYLLVYNGNTGQYDVKQVTTNVSNLGDVVGTPVEGATLVYNATTNKYDVKILNNIPAISGSNTTIAIKATDQSVPISISNNELVYSNTTISLFIGDAGIAKILGGEKYIFVQRATPGLLTSNAALIADSNTFINRIKTEELIVGNNTSNTSSYTSITSISTFANSSQLGNTAYGSNNELVTSAAIKTYVDEAIAAVEGGGASPYTLPIANTSSLGGVKVGSGLTIDSITGVLSATGGGNNGYTLPIAAAGTLGGIKIGSGLSIDVDGVVSVASANGTIGLTAEEARDQAANLFLSGTHTGISFTYDDVNDKINATVTVTGGGANNLNALTDVTISGISNNDILVYDGPSSQWKNYKLNGTPNEIDVTSTSGNVAIGLPNNVSITSNLQVGQQLTVTNVAAFSNNVNVSGSLTVARSTTLQQSLNVTGNTSLNGNTLIVGITSITGNTAVVGGLTVTNNATFSNNLSISNTLFVARQATFSNTALVQGTLTVNSSAQINANLSVTNAITSANVITNNASIASQANIGFVAIQGNTTIGANNSSKLYVNAELASNIIPDANNIYSLGSPERRFKDLYVSGGTIFVDELQLSSPAGGGLLVDGPLQANGTANIVGNTSIGGNLLVAGNTVANGSVVLGDSSTDNISINGRVNTNIIPSGNSLYDLGAVTNYFKELYTTFVYARDGNFSGNVQIDGDLTVIGNLTSLSVATLETEDTIIKLAANNVSDLLDIGFYGATGASPSKSYYGLIRDATDSKFKLFVTSVEPTATVNTAANSFAYQTLVSYLESGGITTNSTSANITANGTFSVTINANTLSLTTALEVVSGGTGRKTFTNNALLIGNGSNALNELIPSTNGTILQIVGGVPTFAHIDCGYY